MEELARDQARTSEYRYFPVRLATEYHILIVPISQQYRYSDLDLQNIILATLRLQNNVIFCLTKTMRQELNLHETASSLKALGGKPVEQRYFSPTL
jgi:hypothetical protein